LGADPDGQEDTEQVFTYTTGTVCRFTTIGQPIVPNDSQA
jgi:hypothetical protein